MIRTKRVKSVMLHSGTHAHHLAGKLVDIIEWDEGESWEEPIAKVRCDGEEIWMNPKDFDETSENRVADISKRLWS